MRGIVHYCSLAETGEDNVIRQTCTEPAHWQLTYLDVEGIMYACGANHRDLVATRMGVDHQPITIEVLRPWAAV